MLGQSSECRVLSTDRIERSCGLAPANSAWKTWSVGVPFELRVRLWISQHPDRTGDLVGYPDTAVTRHGPTRPGSGRARFSHFADHAASRGRDHRVTRPD